MNRKPLNSDFFRFGTGVKIVLDLDGSIIQIKRVGYGFYDHDIFRIIHIDYKNPGVQEHQNEEQHEIVIFDYFSHLLAPTCCNIDIIEKVPLFPLLAFLYFYWFCKKHAMPPHGRICSAYLLSSCFCLKLML